MGSKECHYDAVATKYNVLTSINQPTGRPVVSYDDGKTWTWNDIDAHPAVLGSTVYVSWNPTLSANYKRLPEIVRWFLPIQFVMFRNVVSGVALHHVWGGYLPAFPGDGPVFLGMHYQHADLGCRRGNVLIGLRV